MSELPKGVVQNSFRGDQMFSTMTPGIFRESWRQKPGRIHQLNRHFFIALEENLGGAQCPRCVLSSFIFRQKLSQLHCLSILLWHVPRAAGFFRRSWRPFWAAAPCPGRSSGARTWPIGWARGKRRAWSWWSSSLRSSATDLVNFL